MAGPAALAAAEAEAAADAAAEAGADAAADAGATDGAVVAELEHAPTTMAATATVAPNRVNFIESSSCAQCRGPSTGRGQPRFAGAPGPPST